MQLTFRHSQVISWLHNWNRFRRSTKALPLWWMHIPENEMDGSNWIGEQTGSEDFRGSDVSSKRVEMQKPAREKDLSSTSKYHRAASTPPIVNIEYVETLVQGIHRIIFGKFSTTGYLSRCRPSRRRPHPRRGVDRTTPDFVTREQSRCFCLLRDKIHLRLATGRSRTPPVGEYCGHWWSLENKRVELHGTT